MAFIESCSHSKIPQAATMARRIFRRRHFMEQKRFQKNDNSFICKNCGLEVKPLGYSSRNHCPRCLCSLHVDIHPGDRANSCGGIMRPIQVEMDSKKGYIILHRCEKCGEIRRNRAANEADVQPDNIELLISLTVGTI